MLLLPRFVRDLRCSSSPAKRGRAGRGVYELGFLSSHSLVPNAPDLISDFLGPPEDGRVLIPQNSDTEIAKDLLPFAVVFQSSSFEVLTPIDLDDQSCSMRIEIDDETT
jgi:hypothetical protein